MASANGIRANQETVVGQSTFSEFCQQTSLHGWQHIQSVDTAGGKLQNLIPNLFCRLFDFLILQCGQS